MGTTDHRNQDRDADRGRGLADRVDQRRRGRRTVPRQGVHTSGHQSAQGQTDARTGRQLAGQQVTRMIRRDGREAGAPDHAAGEQQPANGDQRTVPEALRGAGGQKGDDRHECGTRDQGDTGAQSAPVPDFLAPQHVR
ncbi:hypothetical protein GCM10010260_31130 [Streptomyces filipinensis]|uniref:Uncharacterized protein n=1 Tax=Streptomyces filipinensis TaxID=66887 RepID=A0A918MAN8_9ACTN|nr:hypothetical protein [Streptomyces filipinensis]GGU93813.1 hypothetical protein GCM10010260_31130 [Streptomyces filipinensis]